MAASAKGSEVTTQEARWEEAAEHRVKAIDCPSLHCSGCSRSEAVWSEGSGASQCLGPCSQLKHLQGTGRPESETQPGFNVSENHQNQHVKTILAAQSFTNS